MRPKPLPLCLESLEDRVNPSPFDPTGALGALTLNAGDSLVFNTDSGQYQIDGGSWQSGGVLSPDPNQTTMLFNFTTINLPAGSTVTASGSHALGLLGTGDIVINTDLNFSGQIGGNGADGYGSVGGGGGGGGGSGGAVLIDTSGGTITDSGLLNVSGGAAGSPGQNQLSGPNGGGQGGTGGLGVLGGGSGGDGGDSFAGGNGGKGGQGASGGGGGGGGGGGFINGKGGSGGDGGGGGGGGGGGSDCQQGIPGKGGPGGKDSIDKTKASGGAGGAGAPQAKDGSDGADGQLNVYKGEPLIKTYGGGGGGGGGGDAFPKMAAAGAGGRGGAGAGGGATGGQGGNVQASAGIGGGGAFMLVASGGVNFSGTGEYGTGQGAVFGAFTNNGSFPDGLPGVNSYASWQALTANDYYLGGGAGGGGAGGAGQYLPTITMPGMEKPMASSAGAGIYTNAGALTFTSNPPSSDGTNLPSAAQAASPSSAAGPTVPNLNLLLTDILSALDSARMGWPNAPMIPTSMGDVNLSPLVQFLGSNMAGWMAASQDRLEELVLHLDELEHQVVDAVMADLSAERLQSPA